MDNYEVVLKHINNTLIFLGIIVYFIAIPIFISKNYIAYIEKNNCMKN